MLKKQMKTKIRIQKLRVRKMIMTQRQNQMIQTKKTVSCYFNKNISNSWVNGMYMYISLLCECK